MKEKSPKADEKKSASKTLKEKRKMKQQKREIKDY